MVSIPFILGLLAAYWVNKDARKRGSDFGSIVVWTLGSFISFAIFVPLYFIFGRKKKISQNPADADTIDVEATVLDDPFTCTMCGKEVKNGSKHCPYCGHILKPTCKHCGRDVDRYWRNCPYCHEPLDFE